MAEPGKVLHPCGRCESRCKWNCPGMNLPSPEQRSER